MTMATLIAGVLMAATGPSPSGVRVPGDDAFGRIEYDIAYGEYDSLLTAEPHNAQILWRMARLTLCMGDVADESKTEELYRRAEFYARKCVEADSTVAEGHTWLAASLGSIAMFEGSRKKVELTNQIKRELDRALELNPSDDVAYSILGSFYRVLGDVSWFERQLAAVFLGKLPEGGYPEAERALMRAISLAPNVVRHHYELAMVYKEWGRTAEAQREFARAAALPILLARDRGARDRARDWAARLKED